MFLKFKSFNNFDFFKRFNYTFDPITYQNMILVPNIFFKYIWSPNFWKHNFSPCVVSNICLFSNRSALHGKHQFLMLSHPIFSRKKERKKNAETSTGFWIFFCSYPRASCAWSPDEFVVMGILKKVVFSGLTLDVCKWKHIQCIPEKRVTNSICENKEEEIERNEEWGMSLK